MRPRTPALTAGLLLALLAAGCSGTSVSNTAGSGSGSTPATGSSASSPTATGNNLSCDAHTGTTQLADYPIPHAKKRYKVTMLEVTKTGYYFTSLAWSAQQAAKAAGIDLTLFAGQGFYSPAVQLQQAEDAITRGTDAVLLQPADYSGSAPVVQAARNANKPIVDIATEVNDAQVNKVVQDDYGYGQQLADEVAKAVPGGGDGVFIAGPATATWATKRTQGFKDELAAKYPNLHLVAAPQTDIDPARGLAAFENAAQAHPNLKWVASVYEYILPAASLPTAYKGKIKYIAGSYEPEVVAGLKNGTIAAAISTEPIGVARIGVAEIVSMLNGDTVPQHNCVEAHVYYPSDVTSQLALDELLPADRH